MSELWTLVPMRGIEHGKSRLAGALADARRERLNRWLLSNTLKVIEHWRGDLKHCAVVSPCAEALELAQRAGADAVRETTAAAGLNPALILGLMHALQKGAGKVLVLACDLPDLTVDALAALAAAAREPRCMALAPDKLGSGTNALLIAADSGVEFHFGEHSLTRHRAWAEARGFAVTLVDQPALAFDLDTPDDLALWMQRAPLHLAMGG